MDDVILCPICNTKLRNHNENQKIIHKINKKSDYVERICATAYHSFVMWVDKKTKQVDLLKMSLNSDYSRFIWVDFYNKKSTIICLKQNDEETIEIPKIIEPDFPDLKDLKERVGMYIVFS